MTWNGATLYKSTDDGSTYDPMLSVTDSACIGVALTALGDFHGGNVFDELNSVDVVLRSGSSLTSYTELQVLNGAGLVVLGASGRYEVLQYKTATLIGPKKFRLSGLLRGRRGTEWAMRLHEVGDTFVLASLTAWRRVASGTAEIGLERLYKGVTARTKLSSAVAQSFTNTAVGLECYAPVQLGFGRDASDNLTLTWIRRTRIGGEWRNNVDVPLGEDSEQYVVEVLNDDYSGVIRITPVLTAPTWTYTAAQQIEDFGEIYPNPHFKVYQLSASHGRGSALYGSPIPDDAVPDPEPPFTPSAPGTPGSPGTDPTPTFGDTYGPWTMIDPMVEARGMHVAFVIGSQMLLAAGAHYAVGFTRNDGFQMWLNLATGTWTNDTADGLPGSPSGGRGAGQLTSATTFEYGGTHFAIGRAFNTSAATVWEYDPGTVFTFSSHWRVRTDILLDWEMRDQYGALIGDTVYYPTVGVAVDMTGGATTSIASIKALLSAGNIRSTQIFEIGGLIYILGVGDISISGTDCTRTYIYDPGTDTLDTGTACPQSLWGATAVVMDGKIHVFGGAVANESFTLSDRHLTYDPATDTWATKASLPPISYISDGSVELGNTFNSHAGRGGLSATVYGGKIYLAGGNGFIPQDGGSTTGGVSPPSTQSYAKLTLIYDPNLDA